MLGLSNSRATAGFQSRATSWGWAEGVRALMKGAFPQPPDMTLTNVSDWVTYGIPAAWRCVNMIADAAASLPMLAYEQQQDGSEARLDPTPKTLQDPWPMIAYANWVSGTVISMMLRGDAFILPADPDPSTGYPRQFPLLNPDFVWVDVDEFGMPVYDVNGVQFGPGEIIHIRGIQPPGAVRGIGVIEAHRQNLMGVVSMQDYGNTAYSSSGVPSGIITVDRPEIGKEQADDLQSRWMNAFAGRREPAVVPRSITFQPIAFSPEDMSYLESRKWSATEICWMTGVHPMMIGAPAGQSMTYGNLEAMRSAFAQDSVMPWTNRIEETLSKWTPRSFKVKFNYDGFLRSTTLDRYQSYILGLDHGFLTMDEVRDLEHRPRLTPQEVASTETQQQPQPPQLAVVQGGAQ